MMPRCLLQIDAYIIKFRRPTWIGASSPQQLIKASKDLKPACSQALASSKTAFTTLSTDWKTWPKVRRFRSFQIIQKARSTKVSKDLRSTFPNLLRAASHQSENMAPWWIGETECQRPRRRILYQTSLEKEHPTSKCDIVSGSWLQRAQVSRCCRLWRFRLSAVQQRSCRASQRICICLALLSSKGPWLQW